MKSLKSFLRTIDVFGVPFFFRYKGDKKYRTSLGGLFIIIFIVVVLWILIYYFIPFINRKNFTIVYYTMNLPYTEQINLKETKAAFAVGFECDIASDGTKAEDILKLELSFTTQTKNKDGTISKDTIQLTTHPCVYKDFYNNFNDSLDYLNIEEFQCLDDNSQIVEGIYTDEVFSYYSFSVVIKEDTQDNFDKLNDYLLKKDCKLNVYYTDITIDLNNYKNPVRRYLESLFIQLDPNYVKKMNAYFLNQYLYDDNYLIWVFQDEGNSHKETKFSRTEDYSIFKGLDRYQNKFQNYKNYAKLYIRADTKKTEIKRRYQKLMEYYADASSHLIGIFNVLSIIFYFINYFYGENSVEKKIFLLKDFEFKRLNLSQKINQRIELIHITDAQKNKNIAFDSGSSKDLKEYTKNTNYPGRESGRVKMLGNEDINIYNRRKKLLINKSNYDLSKEKSNLKFNVDITPNPRLINRRRKMNKYNTSKKDDYNNNENNKIVYNKEKYFKNNKNFYERNNILRITQKDPFEIINKEKIEYSFNIFEVIGVLLFKCCLSGNLSLKKNINDKANKILYQKLDISLYLRNMLLFDIINQTILEDNIKHIINFVSRPVLSLNKNEDDESESFYKNYTNTEFDKFSKEIYEFAKKSDKKPIEKRLLKISNKHLKDFI